jgi:two-component system OmpR family response regulator
VKILLLEDEYGLRVSIEEFLEELGYSVDGFANGNDAYDALFTNRYDVLLLDVNVPGMNGFDLLRQFREENKETPAIFLTSMTQVNHLKKGYESGCCDYIRKPFDLTELQLRIQQALKNRYFRNAEEQIDLGEGLVYNTKSFKLTYNDEEVPLSKTEKEIMDLLIKHKNQVVSVEMFQDAIWGEYVDPANIRVQINNLRKKLPVNVIQNRRGIGYIIER